MISKEQKLRLGIFLVISSVLLLVILAVFILPKLKQTGDIYFINFRGISVNGINEGSDVKYQGVKIGKVIRLIVNPDDLSSILVYVRIKKNFPIKKDMRASLQYAGITGLKFVEISGGKNESEAVEPGSEISTTKGLGEKAEDIVVDAESVLKALNNILSAENREKISSILSNIQASSQSTANIIKGQEKNISAAVEKFNKALVQISQLSENLTRFSEYLNELKDKAYIEKIAKDADTLLDTMNKRFSKEEMGKVMDGLDKFIGTADSSIKKMESQFSEVSGELKLTLENLRESLDNIARFTRELREDPTILIRTRPDDRSKK